MSEDWESWQERMLDGLVHRTGMLVSRDEYFAVVDFLQGYDLCCGHLDLSYGFHDWLVDRLGLGSSGTAWAWLALDLFPGYGVKEDNGSRRFPGQEREFIEGLGKLLNEYLADRREAGSHGDGDDPGGR